MISDDEIIEFVREYHAREGFPPLAKTIAEHFGLFSLHNRLRELILNGRLVKGPGVRSGYSVETYGVGVDPILPPNQVDFDAKTAPRVEFSWLFGDPTAFCLRYSGIELRHQGIVEGDYIVLTIKKFLKLGQLIAAETEEGLKIGYYGLRDDDYVIENDHGTFRIELEGIRGVVIGLVRQMETEDAD